MEKVFNEEFVLNIFKDSEALLEGHFKLSSGLHSDTYLQCAKVSQYPEYNHILSYMIAKQFESDNIDVVIGPAMGGIIIAYEVAKILDARNIFTERDSERKMSLRRGFVINKGERVLVVEDVVTTGSSVKEVIDIAQTVGAKIVGLAAFVNRSGKKLDFVDKQFYCLNLKIPTYKEKECPLCKQGVPISTPGSRWKT